MSFWCIGGWLETGTAEWRLHVFCDKFTHGKLRVGSTMNLLLFWNAILFQWYPSGGIRQLYYIAEGYRDTSGSILSVFEQVPTFSFIPIVQCQSVWMTSHCTSLATSPISWALTVCQALCWVLCICCFKQSSNQWCEMIYWSKLRQDLW